MTAPKDPASSISQIAKAKGLSLAEAAATSEGQALYAQFREQHHARAASNPPPTSQEKPNRFGEGDHFTPKAVRDLGRLESSIADEARERCAARGVMADQRNIASMVTELLAENPRRYDEYAAVQRRAGGGGS